MVVISERMNKLKQEKKNIVLFLLIYIVFTASCVVFSTLCLYNTGIAFFDGHALLFSVLSAVLLFSLCGFAIWFVVIGKEVLYKTILSVFIFLLFCLVLCFILQKTGFFNVIKDSESLREYLENVGVWMPLLYIVLQYLQVVILPIPSVVSTLAGVALFGPFKAMLYSLLGIVLGSITAFLIGKKLGNKAVAWMVGEETLEKWQKRLKGKDNLVLTIMFVLPVFPDDVLCFVAGLSTMSFRYFTIMIIFSRIFSIATTCYSVDLIPLNTWWGVLIWGLIILAVVIAFILIYKNLDKIQNAISKRFGKTRKRKK